MRFPLPNVRLAGLVLGMAALLPWLAHSQTLRWASQGDLQTLDPLEWAWVRIGP